MKKYKLLIITIFLILIMSVVEIFIKPNYVIKSIIKIICFFVIPLLIAYKDKNINIKSFLKFSKKSIRVALGLGILIYLIIIGSYYVLNNYFDFGNIVSSLNETLKINKSNFIFVALYISFVNSLLEEFFFRGFIFTNFKTKFSRKYTYILSSLLFSLYHISIMNNWFNVWLIMFALIGLFIGGLIFNYFNEKENNIYVSWLIHMFANFGINTIGFILLV